jgi:competence protein ComEC
MVIFPIFILGVGAGMGRFEFARNTFPIRNPCENVIISGSIVQPPSKRNWFLLGAKEVRMKKDVVRVNTLVRVYFKGLNADIGYDDWLVIKGNLVLPSVPSNPFQKDYRMFLKKQNVAAVIYLKEVLQIKRPSFSLRRNIYSLRTSLRKIFYRYLPQRCAGFYSAILLGFKEDLEEEFYLSLKRVGVAHIVVISGFHFFIFYFLISTLLCAIKIRGTRQLIIIIVILSLYVVLSGMQPPVVRAYIITILLLLAPILWRKPDFLCSISFAAFLITLFNPYSVFNTGFQLTFCAVLGIKYISPIFLRFFGINKQEFLSGCSASEHIKMYVLSGLGISISVWLAISPILLCNFNLLTPVLLIANLFVVPYMVLSIVLAPVMIISGLIFGPFAWVVSFGCRWLFINVEYISSLFASLPFSYVYTPSMSTVFIVIYYLMLLVWRQITANKSNFTPLVIIPIVLLCAGGPKIKSKKDDVFIHVFDLGRGACTYVELKNGFNFIYNAGSKDFKNPVQSVIGPFLINRGVSKIDVLFLTSSESDNTNGVGLLLEMFKIDKIVVSRNFRDKKILKMAKQRGAKVIFLDRLVDCTKLNSYCKVIIPPVFFKPDDEGFFVKLEYDGRSFLLCQKVSKFLLEQIVTSGYDGPGCDVLILSQDRFLYTKWALDFLSMAGAWDIVVSGGCSAIFFKHATVLDCDIYTTQRCGAITIRLKNSRVTIEPFF